MTKAMTSINETPAQTAEETDYDPPRVLVACQVGRTGKSTVADMLLAARLDGDIFSVESLNQDASHYGAKVKVYRAEDMVTLRSDMGMADRPVIVDLGASDFRIFVRKMRAAEVFEDFTHCVIVTDPTQRGQDEAITTYQTLRSLGMRDSQFRIVLNKALEDIELEAQFSILFLHAKKNPEFPLDRNCWLPESDLFAGLHENGQGYREVLADKTDYGPLIRAARKAGDRALTQNYVFRQMNQRMVAGMQIHFDNCFKALAIPVSK